MLNKLLFGISRCITRKCTGRWANTANTFFFRSAHADGSSVRPYRRSNNEGTDLDWSWIDRHDPYGDRSFGTC